MMTHLTPKLEGNHRPQKSWPFPRKTFQASWTTCSSETPNAVSKKSQWRNLRKSKTQRYQSWVTNQQKYIQRALAATKERPRPKPPIYKKGPNSYADTTNKEAKDTAIKMGIGDKMHTSCEREAPSRQRTTKKTSAADPPFAPPTQ